MSSQRILFLAPAGAITRFFPALRDAGLEVVLAENLKGASGFVKKSEVDAIFSRPALPGYKVEDLLEVSADDPTFPPIIVIVEKGTADEARHFMQLGAQDYWLEPLNPEKILVQLKQGKKNGPVPGFSTLGGHKPVAGEGIVGSDPLTRRVLALARQVAPSRATVLISGASGTGKEMFARTIHAWSDRANGPFIAVNCAALPEHLLESELFGHEKGAFTGAIARKPGKFELADNGTILLDEISEMDLGLQAKLLRVLQESEIDRVGGTESFKINVRVLATTNRNLEDWVQEGKFRKDLYFRLNVIPLRLPSLKERGGDVLELADYFVKMYIRDYRLPATSLSDKAREWLLEYDWPGNVRELQNLMERAVLLAGGKPILTEHFLLDPNAWPLFDEDGQAAEASAPFSGEFGALPAIEDASLFNGAVMPLHEVERIMIMKGLDKTGGNRTQAAELLGISVRTLRNKLNEYRGLGVDVD